MKKRIVSLLLASALAFTSFNAPYMELKAADQKVEQSIIEPKGQYLQRGTSSISEVGRGKIYASGTTVAQKDVKTVKVSVILEQKRGNSWYHYKSWTAEKHNTYVITSGKTFTVPRKHWYRVRCIHSANSDITDSNTNDLYAD